jgi:Predicted membrane protein (DUF2232).
LKTGVRPVLWSVAAFLLLLLLAVPVLNVAALLLVMVPYVVLYATLSNRAFILHLLPVWVAAGAMMGLPILIMCLFFLVPAVVMGHMYRKQEPAGKVIRTVSVVFLAQLMLELVVFDAILDLSLINAVGDSIRTTFNETVAQNPILAASWNAEMTELLIKTVLNMIPLTFIVLSVAVTVITHYVARRAVRQSGVEVPAFPQAKDWKLPRVLVIYYLIAYIADMMMLNAGDSFLKIALMNLVPLLSYVFAFQAVGFFFFIAHNRGWHRIVPLLIAVPVLLIPPLSLIGVLDTAFPIRKSFTKQ